MDDPIHVLTRRFEETGLGTKSAVKKTIDDYRLEEDGFHHCLTCSQDFEDFKEFRSHVNKRKHRKSKAEIKGLIQEFIEERLADAGISTYGEAVRMYKEDGQGEWRAFTRVEKTTWCRYLVFQGLMETLG